MTPSLDSSNVSVIKDIIEGIGCKLEYLPPYSPDYNPIEYSFTVIKNAIKDTYRLDEDESNEELARRLLAIAQRVVTRKLAVNQFRHCKVDTTGLE